MKAQVAIFIVVFGLIVTAAFLAFGEAQKAGGILLAVAGVIAAVMGKSMATAQNRINTATARYSWNPWGPASRWLYIVWGVGMVIIGIALFLGS